MNESDTPGPETEPPRDRLSRVSEASRRINESLDFDTVLQGVLASARDLTRSRYGRWRPYRRPGWSRDPGPLAVRRRVGPSDAHLDGEGAPQRRRSSRTGSAAMRSRFRRASGNARTGSRTSRASTFAHSQETASGFPARFPGNTDLSRVPVPADDITQFLGVVGLPAR